MTTLAKLLKVQNSIKAQLGIIEADIAAVPVKMTKIRYDANLKDLQDLASSMKANHQEIFKHCADAAAEAAQTDELKLIHNQQLDLLEKLETVKPDAIPNTTQAKVKLPELEVPSFDGDIATWTSFHDLFVATIHNNPNLSLAQKLQYLKTSLKKDASTLVKHLQVTDSNYDEAWKLLKKRFDNQREIINSHLERLYNHPTIKEENGLLLRKLIDTTQECVQALKVLKQPVDTWDTILVFLTCKKLDAESRRQWILSLKSTTYPKFDELLSFIEQRSNALSESGKSKPAVSNDKKVTSHHGTTSNGPSCGICSESHFTYRCQKFSKMSPHERRQAAQQKRLCLNCLRSGHRHADCSSESTCRKCSQKHHTMLHLEKTSSPAVTSAATTMATSLQTFTSSQVLLPTAVIQVKDSCGQLQSCRALLDSCSEVSLISIQLVKKLGISKCATSLTIHGVSSTKVGHSQGRVQLDLTSRVYPFTATITAYILDKVTSRLPGSPVPTSDLTYLKGLRLADPFYHKPEDVDVLIGADLFTSLLRSTPVIRGPPGYPNAVDTELGWVVTGPTPEDTPSSASSYHIHCELEGILARFWEIESTPATSSNPTSEEQMCEQHYADTHTRLSNGKYLLRLPLKPEASNLGSSRALAIRRLQSQERRLVSNPNLYSQYIDFIREYKSLGHMKKVSYSSTEPVSYYLPHHCVLKESSSTTKLRVVFDGSAKSNTGLSLNDVLMVGPKVHDDLIPILLRFRMWLIPILADAKMMYRMFLIHPDDWKYQRIVWRDNLNDPIEDYALTTVTYGEAASSFLATRTMKQLAMDEQTEFPQASIVLQRDAYVDDILTGADCQDAAISLYEQLSSLCNKGGIELRKWASTNAKLLSTIPLEHREATSHFNLDTDSTIKSLGLHWSPSLDSFTFAVVSPPPRDVNTKRTLLSDISKIFDPLGWLSPVTIKNKVLFQSLWSRGLTWDEPLPPDVLSTWTSYHSQLHHIGNVKIPRHCILSCSTEFSLLGFCDASQTAYAACVYLKSSIAESHKVQLLIAKTRVAPAKQESIPRLELCGAVLLQQLVLLVQQTLLEQIQTVHLWTDSTIVLHWLSAAPSKWMVFVANRVSQIQQHFPRSHWHHVRSEDNPADPASRGISPEDLPKLSLWWSGPSWLTSSSYNFADEPPAVTNPSIESRPAKVWVTSSSPTELWFPVESVSSLAKLRWRAAHCLRFIYNCRHSKARRIGQLTAKELDDALLSVIKSVQQCSFPTEISHLQSNQCIPNKSPLIRLHPMLLNGLLRVGGRLQNSDLTPDQMHPVILPRRHHLTNLIIIDTHVRNLHSGPQALVAHLHRQFWILNCRDVVRKVIRKCILCFRYRAQSASQLMSNLPSCRVLQAPAFNVCGIDYAGPLTIRRVIGGRSNQTTKSYVAVFVCFVTHAIHLELVSDLTTNAFLASLRRFTSRRGYPAHIHTDCGTNFVGASRELEKFRAFVHDQSSTPISSFASSNGISWHFNPPGSPHFGGLWESAVRLMKTHLLRVVGPVTLNFEEMATILCQVEACVNSRPLTLVSQDPDDLAPLTPGHFLIGQPLNALPEPDLTDLKINRLSRWQLCQQLTQHFWRRWQDEFIVHLQQRQKWSSQSENLRIGTLVLLKDERLPPIQWKLARILELHPGKDALVRVVTIKTAEGVYKRPIIKLGPLPIDST